MPIRDAQIADLTRIVAIYNAAVPGRRATADTEPVTASARAAWFRDFETERRPLWVTERQGNVQGWLSLRSFCGRPACQATVEPAVYAAPQMQRRGIGRKWVAHAVEQSPSLGTRTIVAFVFGHNAQS